MPASSAFLPRRIPQKTKRRVLSTVDGSNHIRVRYCGPTAAGCAMSGGSAIADPTAERRRVNFDFRIAREICGETVVAARSRRLRW